MTRGLREMTRLGEALGANPLTFQGLSGMGDLMLTCTGDLSRNRSVGSSWPRAGEAQRDRGEHEPGGRGRPDHPGRACRLANRLGVEMPIAAAVKTVLDGEATTPAEAGLALMTRQLPRAELE